MTTKRPRPIALIILDGWGYREDPADNAILAAHKPNWDAYWQHYPHTCLSGSGHCVGLPEGQMGNSEVGHLTMGAGRLVYQDLTRIDLAIENGEFFQNAILINAMLEAKKNHKAVHLMGLLSPGGVHSHERHLQALISLATQLNIDQLYIHAFLDGRDTPPKSAQASLNIPGGRIVSLIGRYYAMDRDKRWDRIQIAYDLLVDGKAQTQAETAEKGLALAYERGETDEFVLPTRIHADHESPVTIQSGDTVIFANFRSDRAREITQAFTDPNFKGFKREHWPQINFICLSEYDSQFNLPVAFPSQSLKNLLGDYVSEQGLRQLRIAETEKYAHVTFFFNGGVEKPSVNEDRILIPSPLVATYDLIPEMSAKEITDRLVQEIQRQTYDLIICNFANPDMVGHTGDFAATVKAIETIDTCLGKIISALLAVGGEAIITADHGNAEKMYDHTTKQMHTAHTSDPVPFLYIGERAAEVTNEKGTLRDIAPTLLYLMGLKQPEEMTGKSLVRVV